MWWNIYSCYVSTWKNCFHENKRYNSNSIWYVHEVTATSFKEKTYSVQHLEHFVLLTGVQPVDDDHQPCLVLREAVDGFCHPSHQFHFTLQNLWERADSTADMRKFSTFLRKPDRKSPIAKKRNPTSSYGPRKTAVVLHTLQSDVT